MRSLARPRKITIQGTDGQTYMFLGKPKDDLRKDARLMDFNAIINKLLKSNSESRRRRLREYPIFSGRVISYIFHKVYVPTVL
jgi:serine/threonine-protein kinase ATR